MNTEVQKISVDKIIPNRFQPRKNFDEEALDELADSIRQHGIIQPLVLRKLGDSYEIIAGERRYKAAQKVSLKEVPAIVMELDDTSSAEIALVENIQRKDLTAIEEAKSYEKILELGQINQEELAKRVGRNQSTVSNKLRLLNLSEEAQQALLDNRISERHARSLLRLKDNVQQNEMLNKIIENRMTVRETDKEIKNLLGENQIDQFEIEEIIDIDSDIPAVSDNQVNPFDEIKSNPVIETVQPIQQENNNNSVYINPEIVPSEETKLNVPIEIPTFEQNTIESNNQAPIGGRFFNLDDEQVNMNMGNNETESNNYIDPSTFMPTNLPNFDEHQINPQNILQNNYTEQINQSNNIQNSPQPIIQRQDITGAVSVIRNTIMNLQNNGYIINVSEQDSIESHQIIIDLKK
ncbi:MAG: ParB/RepB/Spo0J family partition protein [Firmicutes bacterium]|nr:ParB/RepB/Spo0J family partition protein [Bacillota bacterium]